MVCGRHFGCSEGYYKTPPPETYVGGGTNGRSMNHSEVSSGYFHRGSRGFLINSYLGRWDPRLPSKVETVFPPLTSPRDAPFSNLVFFRRLHPLLYRPTSDALPFLPLSPYTSF